jgi:hypothetical protein
MVGFSGAVAGSLVGGAIAGGPDRALALKDCKV